jgi:hypothetical protein
MIEFQNYIAEIIVNMMDILSKVDAFDQYVKAVDPYAEGDNPLPDQDCGAQDSLP